jgi:hypothetical protein
VATEVLGVSIRDLLQIGIVIQLPECVPDSIIEHKIVLLFSRTQMPKVIKNALPEHNLNARLAHRLIQNYAIYPFTPFMFCALLLASMKRSWHSSISSI